MRKWKYYSSWLAGVLPLLLALFWGGRAYAENSFTLRIGDQDITTSGDVTSSWIKEGSVKTNITTEADGSISVHIYLASAKIERPAADQENLAAISYSGKGAVVMILYLEGYSEIKLDPKKEGTTGLLCRGDYTMYIKNNTPYRSRLDIDAATPISVNRTLSVGSLDLHLLGNQKGISCEGDDATAELSFEKSLLFLRLEDISKPCIDGFSALDPALSHEKYVLSSDFRYENKQLLCPSPNDAPCSKILLQQVDDYRGIMVSGIPVTAENENNILGDGTVVYDHASKTLTLQGLQTFREVANLHQEGLTINLQGENKLSSTDSTPPWLIIAKNTTLTGTGSLEVDMPNANNVQIGASRHPVTLTIKETTLKMTGQSSFCERYITNADARIFIEKANVELNASQDLLLGIKSFETKQLTSTPKYVVEKETNGSVALKDQLGGTKLKSIRFAPSSFEEYDLWIGGVQVTSENAADLATALGGMVELGEEGKFSFAVDSEGDYLLQMTNVTLKAPVGQVGVMAKKNLKVTSKGKNNIYAKGARSIVVEKKLSLEGDYYETEFNLQGSLQLAEDELSVAMPLSVVTDEESALIGVGGTPTVLGVTKLSLKATKRIFENVILKEGLFGFAFSTHTWVKLKDGDLVDEKGELIKEATLEHRSSGFFSLFAIDGYVVNRDNINKLHELPYFKGGELFAGSDNEIYLRDAILVGSIEFASSFGLYLEGANQISSTQAGLTELVASDYPLTILGSGSLTLSAPAGVALRASNLTIRGCAVAITGAPETAIDVTDLRVEVATLSAQAKTTAIKATNSVTLTDAKYEDATLSYDNSKEAVVGGDGQPAKEVKIIPTKVYTGVYINGKPITTDKLSEDLGEGKYKYSYDPDNARLVFSGKIATGVAIESTVSGLVVDFDADTEIKGFLKFSGDTRLYAEDGVKVTIEGSADAAIRSTSDLTFGKGTFLFKNNRYAISLLDLPNLKLCFKQTNVKVENSLVTAFCTGDIVFLQSKIKSPEGAIVTTLGGGLFQVTTIINKDGAIVGNLEIEKDETLPYFLVTPTTLSEFPAAGGSPSVTVTSDKAWSLTIPAEATWLSASTMSGTGTSAVMFTVTRNETTAARSATVTFTQAETNVTLTLEVKQAAAESTPTIFTLTPATLAELPAAGGSPSVTVTSDKAWSLTIPAEATWLSASAMSGTGTATITFTVAKNEITTARSATVTFTQAETSATRTLEVTQAAAAPIHIPLTGLSFVESAVTIKVGSEATLALNFEPANATNKNVTWAVSEGSDKLTVDANGKITAGATAGTAKVTATSEENTTIKKECTVTITVEDVPVASLTLSSSTLNLTMGGTEQLFATVKPSTATHKTVTWAVTNGTEVVSVSATGLVTALKAGTATVTATAGGKTATCGVTVTEAPISTFTLDPTTLAELPAAGGSPSVTVNSDKAWSLTIPTEATWVSASTMSGTGTEAVTFTVTRNETAAARSATVTFTQAETNATLTLDVKQAAGEAIVPLTGLSINPKELPIKVGTSAKLRLEFTPANATNKNVTWAVTEGAASLEVDQDGKITATQVAGTAKVTVTSVENPTVTATCTVTVTTEDVPVESLTISSSSLTLTVGATNQLSVTVKPQTATNKTPQWSTSSAEIATVNASGLVTAVAVGTATITASIGSKTATCTVTVNAPPTAVEDALLAGVVVAPNPFASQLRILNPEGVSVAYELVNLAGVVLRAGVVAGVETTVDTADLSAGLYFVRLTGENGASRTVRVVKNTNH